MAKTVSYTRALFSTVWSDKDSEDHEYHGDCASTPEVIFSLPYWHSKPTKNAVTHDLTNCMLEVELLNRPEDNASLVPVASYTVEPKPAPVKKFKASKNLTLFAIPM